MTSPLVCRFYILFVTKAVQLYFEQTLITIIDLEIITSWVKYTDERKR